MPRKGRPLKFKTVEELTEKVERYFNTVPLAEWTITGLALALDTSRQTLLEYEGEVEGREEKSLLYADTIKKAKLMVENSYEIDLKKHGRTGTIFALKNFDWKDKTETDLTSDGKPIFQIINYGAENNNNPVQLPTESLPVTISEKPSEIQNSSTPQESGQIKDSTQPTDTEKPA